jgi:uncharacterized protein
LQKAAVQGIPEAEYLIGRCYVYGYGVKQDLKEADKWFKKSVQQGDSDAQYELGICYFKGIGVKQDYSEAKNWIRKAAKQGNEEAIENLKELENDKQ